MTISNSAAKMPVICLFRSYHTWQHVQLLKLRKAIYSIWPHYGRSHFLYASLLLFIKLSQLPVSLIIMLKQNPYYAVWPETSFVGVCISKDYIYYSEILSVRYTGKTVYGAFLSLVHASFMYGIPAWNMDCNCTHF